jgi:hypothetical protein
MLIAVSGSGGPVSTRPSADGSFVLKDLSPGHYTVRVLPERVMNMAAIRFSAGPAISARLGTKEVLQHGFDVAGEPVGPLRITLSTREIHVTGKVVDAAGRPRPGSVVLLQSRQTAPQAIIRTDAEGGFECSLPLGGEYRIYAVGDASQMQSLFDPDYLKAHENDFPAVRLADGQNAPLTLRLPLDRPRAERR